MKKKHILTQRAAEMKNKNEVLILAEAISAAYDWIEAKKKEKQYYDAHKEDINARKRRQRAELKNKLSHSYQRSFS